MQKAHGEYGYDEEVHYKSFLPEVADIIGTVGDELIVADFAGLLDRLEEGEGSIGDGSDCIEETPSTSGC